MGNGPAPHTSPPSPPPPPRGSWQENGGKFGSEGYRKPGTESGLHPGEHLDDPVKDDRKTITMDPASLREAKALFEEISGFVAQARTEVTLVDFKPGLFEEAQTIKKNFSEFTKKYSANLGAIADAGKQLADILEIVATHVEKQEKDALGRNEELLGDMGRLKTDLDTITGVSPTGT
jgi:hypothetical protein